jgi:hypothetical protein
VRAVIARFISTERLRPRNSPDDGQTLIQNDVHPGSESAAVDDLTLLDEDEIDESQIRRREK